MPKQSVLYKKKPKKILSLVNLKQTKSKALLDNTCSSLLPELLQHFIKTVSAKMEEPAQPVVGYAFRSNTDSWSSLFSFENSLFKHNSSQSAKATIVIFSKKKKILNRSLSRSMQIQNIWTHAIFLEIFSCHVQCFFFYTVTHKMCVISTPDALTWLGSL